MDDTSVVRIEQMRIARGICSKVFDKCAHTLTIRKVFEPGVAFRRCAHLATHRYADVDRLQRSSSTLMVMIEMARTRLLVAFGGVDAERRQHHHQREVNEHSVEEALLQMHTLIQVGVGLGEWRLR